MSGGTDISFLRGFRVPCAILLVVFVALMVLAVGSCVSCIMKDAEPTTEPIEGVSADRAGGAPVTIQSAIRPRPAA